MAPDREPVSATQPLWLERRHFQDGPRTFAVPAASIRPVRASEEVYVLREHMTLDERRANVARLRAEAASKARHADALEAETEALLARGLLSAAA